MREFEILITSPPDRENLVAEIWLEENLVAELNNENDFFELEIYFSKKKDLVVEYEKFIKALKLAKERLMPDE